jgi:type IV secretion system protein VirB8
MNKVDYFTRAESWAINAQETTSRSRRTAWTIAGIAAGIAMLEAVALAMLTPLKTVQPITLLVDRQTGFVQALDPVHPRPIAANEALTQSFLAQYVAAREGFDRATLPADYRKVALWSSGPARSAYLAEMPATNPASPLSVYALGTVVNVRVKSVSKLSEGTALVRFDTLRQDRNGYMDTGQPWVAVIRYRFVDAPMQIEDRLVNPLGFQVITYRRDAEGPPPAPIAAAAAAGYPVDQPFAIGPASQAAAIGAVQMSAGRAPVERRAVPINQLPMGSPLAPGSRGQ